MSTIYIDANGHEVPQVAATALTAGAVSTTAVGTIVGTTSAGAAPTVTATDATDRRGSFLLNPVTGGGAQAAGSVAEVRFAKPYSAIPRAVLVSIMNETDSTAVHAVSAGAVTVAGFSIFVGAVLVTAKAYRVNYLVVP